MIGRIIETSEDVAEGTAWLAAHEPRFAPVLAVTSPLPLRRKSDGFAALMDAIVSQQVSVASANAIRARMGQAGLMDQAVMVEASDEALRSAGLSRQKARYGRALAQSGIDFAALRLQTDAEVVGTLVQVPGIGRWTAEIYAMFALGRADVFAPGDLALQVAAQSVFALNERPSEPVLRRLSENWSPWRAVAARTLFAYYHVLKDREGI